MFWLEFWFINDKSLPFSSVYRVSTGFDLINWLFELNEFNAWLKPGGDVSKCDVDEYEHEEEEDDDDDDEEDDEEDIDEDNCGWQKGGEDVDVVTGTFASKFIIITGL